MELIPIIKTILLVISAVAFLAVVFSYAAYKLRKGEKAGITEAVHVENKIKQYPAVVTNSKLAQSSVYINKGNQPKNVVKKTGHKKPVEKKKDLRFTVLNDKPEYSDKDGNQSGNFEFKNPYTNQKFHP